MDANGEGPPLGTPVRRHPRWPLATTQPSPATSTRSAQPFTRFSQAFTPMRVESLRSATSLRTSHWRSPNVFTRRYPLTPPPGIGPQLNSTARSGAYHRSLGGGAVRTSIPATTSATEARPPVRPTPRSAWCRPALAGRCSGSTSRPAGG
jgi:hypothetical protein